MERSAYHPIPYSGQLPLPNGSGLMPSGEANFFDFRQQQGRDPTIAGYMRNEPINSFFPVLNDSLGSLDRQYPPTPWDRLYKFTTDTTTLEAYFWLSGIYITYPTRTSGELIGANLGNPGGQKNATSSGIAHSILAAEGLSFPSRPMDGTHPISNANLSNATDTLAGVKDRTLYDFEIFNPYVHYYGKTTGTPMPKWRQVAGTNANKEQRLKTFSDVTLLNYSNVYPKVPSWKEYEDRDPYEPTGAEGICAASGGVMMSGKCWT